MANVGLLSSLGEYEAGPRPAISGGGLDPLLTRQLDREHLQLVELYNQSQLLLCGGDYQGSKHRLGALLVRVRDYAQLKDAFLYSALADQHAFDPFIMAIINECRAMTGKLVEAADSLFNGVNPADTDDESIESFKGDLHGLGADLTHCFEKDVSILFPLYRKALLIEKQKAIA